MYNLILNRFYLNDTDIISVFPYGSRVYGTADNNSDYDFIIITKNHLSDKDALESSNDKLNAIIWTEDSFCDKIKRHVVPALECISLEDNFLLKNSKKFEFVLNKSLLRSSFSEKSSHAWVKAKKKFEVEADRNVYIAKKSLFHSLRILEFGMQIARYGKIKYFDAANDLWLTIKSDPNDNWPHYKEQYQKLYNQINSEFKKLAPK